MEMCARARFWPGLCHKRVKSVCAKSASTFVAAFVPKACSSGFVGVCVHVGPLTPNPCAGFLYDVDAAVDGVRPRESEDDGISGALDNLAYSQSLATTG